MDNFRFEHLDKVLGQSKLGDLFWCEAKGGCACAGCVNVGYREWFIRNDIVPPTYSEFLEYKLKRIMGLYWEQNKVIEELSKLPPTYSGYKRCMELIEVIKKKKSNAKETAD